MATSNNKEEKWDLNYEINRVKENHKKLEKQIERITDKLCLERDQASDERFHARRRNESMRKKLADSREEVQNAKVRLRKLKDLADEEINSLTSERDDSIEEKLAFDREYKENEEALKNVINELSNIEKEHRELTEQKDEITDRLIIERDKASDERHRARLRNEEIKTRKSNIEENDRYKDDLFKLTTAYDENNEILESKPTETSEKDTAISKNNKVLITGRTPLSRSNDSGIELDLDGITQEIKNEVDIFVSKKLCSLGIRNINDTRASNNEERKSNIIIHGLEENNESDEVYIKKIFDAMDMEIGPALAHRLGAKKENRARPVKMVMRSESDKASFMSRLWMLKHKLNQKIRVTDDYTWEEREEIRRWVKMADERNGRNNDEATTNYIWKARGTPKTGMRIVQIRM